MKWLKWKLEYWTLRILKTTILILVDLLLLLIKLQVVNKNCLNFIAKYKQENSDLNFKDIYKYAKNPDKFIDPNSANMKSNGFWNSWFKHTMNKTCTPRQIDQFLLEEYGAKVLYYEIYPDFLSKEGFEEKEGYDQPIINEFLTYLDLNNDDFCILHIGWETVIEGVR